MLDHAEVRILPPVIFLIGLGCAIAAASLSPVRLAEARASAALGVFFVTVSLVIVLAAVTELRRAKTAFDVRKPTSALVATGPFALSRNPVYLAMMMLFVGLAFLANSAWALVFAIPTGGALCRLAIRPEERYLERKFGAAYRRYKASAPRWI